MFRDRLQDRQEARRQVEAAAEKMPCANCGDKSAGGILFEPDEPEAFNLQPGQKIVVGLCAYCLVNPPDLEFLEATLKDCGYQTTDIDDHSLTEALIKGLGPDD